MKKINYLQKAEDVIIVLTFVVMTLSAFLQVCNRNITKIPVTGFEELSKYCMIYMVLLGTRWDSETELRLRLRHFRIS